MIFLAAIVSTLVTVLAFALHIYACRFHIEIVDTMGSTEMRQQFQRRLFYRYAKIYARRSPGGDRRA